MRNLSAFLIAAVVALCALPTSAVETLAVVYNDDYPPYSYLENGVLVGIEVDLVNEIAKRIGINVTNDGFPWPRAQSMVASGAADAFVTIATPARLEFTVASKKALFTNEVVAAVGASNPRLKEISGIKTIADTLVFQHVSFRNSGWAKLHLARASQIEVTQVSQVLQLLESGRADLFLDGKFFIQHNIHKMSLENKVIILPAVLDSAEFRIMIRKSSNKSLLMGDIDKAIADMSSDGTFKKILLKYGIKG